MVDFRRVMTALAVLALFVGLASAQVGSTGQSQLTCATNVTVTPALRAEGYTEQTGDITISCTGGVLPAVGATVPLVNITIFYNALVTSRLLPVQSVNSSEALLLIDEPGSALPGFGPSLPQSLCPTPAAGCPAVAGFTTGTPFEVAVQPGTTTPAFNVYQGVVAGNSVTFNGVPVMPPTTTGSRVFRITNVRINANQLGGLSTTGGQAVTASISISNPTSLSISQSFLNVGFVSPGLSASYGTAAGFTQCTGPNPPQLAQTITFQEQFSTAFKTRGFAQANTANAGQLFASQTQQNVPGGQYYSESNFILPNTAYGAGTLGTNPGLADYGTRLKATFNNVPSGVSVYVDAANTQTPPAVVGGSAANASTGSAAYVGYAQLISVAGTDSNADGTTFAPITKQPSAVTLVNGSGAAVWEAVNTNPNTIESFSFGVYISYTPNISTNTPAPGTATVTLSFAPTATSGAASSTLPIPRFSSGSLAAANLFTITVCRTILLYPFVTNQAGFDTGLTIANTSQDPFTIAPNVTGSQTGSCSLNYYGGTTAAPTVPPAAGNTGPIAGGSYWKNTVGTIAPTFEGYIFAVCNFQYAHGFAFISDVGARNLAMGYLALIIPDPGPGVRNPSPACQGEGNACANTGEEEGH